MHRVQRLQEPTVQHHATVLPVACHRLRRCRSSGFVEFVFDQAARFFRVIAKDRRALVIAATLLSPGRGCRDGWTITVNADVSFVPTGLGADCPISPNERTRYRGSALRAKRSQWRRWSDEVSVTG